MNHNFFFLLYMRWLIHQTVNQLVSEKRQRHKRRLPLFLFLPRHSWWFYKLLWSVSSVSSASWMFACLFRLGARVSPFHDNTLIDSICFHPFQITVYLGKRDFVDHVSHVEPIGQLIYLLCFVSRCLSTGNNKRAFFARLSLSFLD